MFYVSLAKNLQFRWRIDRIPLGGVKDCLHDNLKKTKTKGGKSL
jgi:hypothetical protein